LIVSPILAARETIFQFIKNDLVKGIFDTLYYILPKTSELGSITQALVKKEQIVSFQPFYTSAAFMLLTFGLSIFIFRKKDY
jgi:hypothetical protein